MDVNDFIFCLRHKAQEKMAVFRVDNPPFLIGTILKSELENLEDDFSRREMGLLLATTM